MAITHRCSDPATPGFDQLVDQADPPPLTQLQWRALEDALDDWRHEVFAQEDLDGWTIAAWGQRLLNLFYDRLDPKPKEDVDAR